tara:strand:+ start:224 stop:913 length:690 start_codon:yes stop_codon:yes gene_type:complete
MYSAGDLVQFDIHDTSFYGEVLGVDADGKIEVSRLKQTKKQGGRIWEFVDDDKWSAIDAKYVKKHVQVSDSARRSQVTKAWRVMGFVPGGDGITFCRLEDEDETTLPLLDGDSSDDSDAYSDSEEASANPAMHGYADDGFVVPDDEGSEFEFADPDELEGEAAQFVRETHQAVRDFDNWTPEDRQGKAIKAFVVKMDQKASIETDNHRLAKGKPSITTSKPPLKKRRRK